MVRYLKGLYCLQYSDGPYSVRPLQSRHVHVAVESNVQMDLTIVKL